MGWGEMSSCPSTPEAGRRAGPEVIRVGEMPLPPPPHLAALGRVQACPSPGKAMSMGELSSLLTCHVKVWVGERCPPLLPTLTTATEEGTDPVGRGMDELALRV